MKSLFTLFTFVFFLLSFSNIYSQNLLRNGSFEGTRLPDGCRSSFDINDVSINWYGKSSIYLNDCIDNYQKPHIVYEWRFSEPIDGQNTLRIISAPWGDKIFDVGLAATELQTPLKKDRYYLFEGFVQNKGIGTWQDSSYYDCVDEPFRHYQLLVSDKRFEGTVEHNLYFSTLSGREVARNDSTYMRMDGLSDWRKVKHCFQAEGGEKHFGISGPRGNFKFQKACEGKFPEDKLFHLSVFDFDDIKLYEVPKFEQAEQTVCSDEPTPVYLKRLFTHPIFQDATFEWDNGIVDSISSLQQAGTYLIQASVGCTKIPLELIVTSETCTSKVYVPNAFSPNGDNINDILTPHLRTFWETKDYKFSIFDRWGNQIFQTKNTNTGWNGRVQNDLPQRGTYVWMITYTLLRDDREIPIVKSGEVVLLR